MKKMKFLLLLFVVYCLSSCQIYPLYSCDPSIEKWASENLSAINRLDREQLLNLGNDSYRKAAYRGFSSEKKQKIWKEKYLELKKLNWSKACLLYTSLGRKKANTSFLIYDNIPNNALLYSHDISRGIEEQDVYKRQEIYCIFQKFMYISLQVEAQPAIT